MKAYNGFTPAQRMKAQRWLNAQWASGALVRPTVCCACGQPHGIIDAHAEDYSEPFRAGVTDAYHLCFRCHMMVHCRYRALFAWQRYKRAIATGIRYAGFKSRNFPVFASQHLDDDCSWPEPEFAGDPPMRRVLDEIA